MKTKDLVYIGIIAYLAYLLVKKKPKAQEEASTTLPDGTTNNTLGTTVGNGTNGGLNLGANMDLPNLTPTSPNGLSTEVALNSSNVTPIIKDENLPTQIFGNVSLPAPYYSTSVVNPNPVDVVPAVSTTPSPVASTTPSPAVSTTPVPATSTTVSETIIAEPIGTVSAPPIKNTSTVIDYQEVVEPIISTNPTPIATGTSVVSEPVFPIKTVKAELITNEPILGNSLPLSQDVSDEIISECGNSFSIPNNDKEGSYTNFWFDGKEYYTQTTSPLIKTIPTKISKLAYVEGCKKLQLFKLQNSKV
jgi:hypothetical protein